MEKADDRLNVKTAQSGKKALEMIEKEENFEVIVSDYKMIGLDGLELLKKVREKGIETPFIFLSGRGNKEVENEALNSGADEFIQKKGSPRKLYNKLSQTIPRVLEKD